MLLFAKRATYRAEPHMLLELFAVSNSASCRTVDVL
jgi:hypothetical protein